VASGWSAEREGLERMDHLGTDTSQRVAEILRPVLGDQGVVGWLNRPRHQLDGRTPAQLLMDGDDDTVLEMAIHLSRSA
jgi:hypothetical protein